jgi:3',5'-cyclic AMP phosphodiesterase CpdA
VSGKPVLIAQISDLHVKRPDELAYGKVDTAAALRRCVAHLNQFRPRPSIVVISGDLVDTPNADEYAHLVKLLGSLEIPYVAVPGNHDSREMERAALPHQPYARASGPTDLTITIDGIDLILLDSSVPEEPYGFLEEESLTWLDQVCAASEAPAMVFLHHPPFEAGIWHMDRNNLRNAPELAGMLQRHRRVQHVGTGHIHRAVLTRFAGIPTSICPAPNHAVDLDIGAERTPGFVIEPPAFHLHWWMGEANEGRGAMVTHFVPIGEHEGPYPFFDAAGRLL